jgi:hypothetical protein
MPFAFWKVLVDQTSFDFADAYWSASNSFPREHGFLLEQLKRASLSIAANLAEDDSRSTMPSVNGVAWHPVISGSNGARRGDTLSRCKPSGSIGKQAGACNLPKDHEFGGVAQE